MYSLNQNNFLSRNINRFESIKIDKESIEQGEQIEENNNNEKLPNNKNSENGLLEKNFKNYQNSKIDNVNF